MIYNSVISSGIIVIPFFDLNRFLIRFLINLILGIDSIPLVYSWPTSGQVKLFICILQIERKSNVNLGNNNNQRNGSLNEQHKHSNISHPATLYIFILRWPCLQSGSLVVEAGHLLVLCLVSAKLGPRM